MQKYRWFYLLLFINFLASTSIILFAFLIEKNDHSEYFVLPMCVVWILFMIGSLIPILIRSVGHLRQAIAQLKEGNEYGLRQGMKRMKMASIPYFVANFIYFFALALLLFAASRGFIIFTPIPLIFVLAILITYIVMCCTSVYGVAYIIYLKKADTIKKGAFFIHIIFNFIFVLDVLDSLYLLCQFPKDEKHGWKKTVVVFTLILAILLLGGYVVWRVWNGSVF